MPTLRSLPLILLSAFAACASAPSETRRYQRDEVAPLLKRLESVGLELGVFPIDGAASVVDGDTLRVRGLTSSLRLLAVDTEETFKRDSERGAFALGWEKYKRLMSKGSSHPVKMATPLGEEAKTWAQAFFEGVDEIRLERDHPGEIRDYYGRYLAYIFVKRHERWLNFNVELVRSGMSPYFVKYGRSRRFHKDFLLAQQEAQDKKLGIWGSSTVHYDDYPERLKWWGAREAVISQFERQAEEDPSHNIALTRFDAWVRLEQMIGQTVTVLGSVREIRFNERGPAVVKLSRSRGSDLDVVFFDRDVLMTSGIQYKDGEYVQVRGQVQKYKNKYNGQERLQLLVTLPGQVLAPSAALDRLLSTEESTPQTEDAEPAPGD